MEPIKFSCSINRILGRNPDNPKDVSGIDVGGNWEPVRITIDELVAMQSAHEVGGVLRGGVAIASAHFRAGRKKDDSLIKFGLICVDIDAKEGWTIEERNEYFPKPQDWIDRGFGDKLAAVLPTTSVPDGTTSTIGHLFFPLERSLTRACDITAVLEAIQDEILAAFPEIHGSEVLASRGKKGGYDPCSDKPSQYMAGMRRGQQALYINNQAFLSREWIQQAIDRYQAGLEELGIQPHVGTFAEVIEGGHRPRSIKKLKQSSRKGKRLSIPSVDTDSSDEYVTDQMLYEINWFLQNYLGAPGEGTYEDYVKKILHFTVHMHPLVDDIFIHWINSDDTGHRTKTQSAESMLNSALRGFTDSGWSKLVQALNLKFEQEPNQTHWMKMFYLEHGYHTCLSFYSPSERTQHIAVMRNVYTLTTGNDDLRCDVDTEM